MAIYNETSVVVKGVVVWDGITRPQEQQGNGKIKHSCKILIAPEQSEIAEINSLVQTAIDKSEFAGRLPKNAKLPLGDVQDGEFGEQFNGYKVVNAGTYNGAPTVYDQEVRPLPALKYKDMLYPGAVVNLLIHPYTYNVSGNVGVAMGLDSVQIVDNTTERLQLGSKVVDGSKAFGKVSAPPAQPAPPANDLVKTPTMTEKANGFTREQYHEQGWTDEQLVDAGMMYWV